MADEVKSEETTTDIPYMSITDAQIEEGSKLEEETRKILTPPAGHRLVGLRSFCPKHGDITRASKVIPYKLYQKNEDTGKVVQTSSTEVVCLACLAEFWREHIVTTLPKFPDGTPGTIKVAPVFVTEAEYRKIVLEQAQKEFEDLDKVKDQYKDNPEFEKQYDELKMRIADLEKQIAEDDSKNKEETKTE